MNKQTFNTILWFTGSVLAGIIVLQAVWLVNISDVRKNELKTSTQQALTEAINRLEKKEQTRMVVNRMDDFLPDSVFHEQTEMIKVMVDNFDSVQTINVNGSTTHQMKVTSREENVDDKGNREVHISTQQITMPPVDSLFSVKVKSMDSLVQQMVVEIDNRDLGVRLQTDTLTAVLKNELHKKGIDAGFEYRVLQGDSVVYTTPGFVVSSAWMNFRSKLFPHDIFDKNLTLEMCYPASSSMRFVFRRMQTSLMLSALFTLGVMIAFYITLRSINRQKKLSEMKSDFINNITHEFKTPIATSSIAISALENKLVRSDEERFGYYTQVLKEENRKMNEQVEKVLQMAMMDKNLLETHLERTDIHEVLEESISGFGLIIHTMDVELVYHPEAESSWVMTDTFHIRNVFNNVIDNAIKYSGEGAKLEISTRVKGKELLVFFKDNGRGMSAEVKKYAFEKFYRGQKGNFHEVKGFGLGLSYAKNIVEQSGGRIELISEAGKGTEVIVHLPLA